MASHEGFRIFFDSFVKLRYLPPFAIMPLLILMTGVDEANKIIFLIISISLYFLPSVILAVDSVPDELIDTARTLGASEKQIIWRILIPYSMPDIFQNFLIINGISWNALMVGEMINAKYGLGHVMNMARQRGQMDVVLVVLMIIYFFAIVLDHSINKLIRKLFKWKYA
ncbi:MAG: ABC transporter permease subunit [Desulfobacterales bacterium]|nr:ABC transporter permease subunit [Desulfobacterales bacterium]